MLKNLFVSFCLMASILFTATSSVAEELTIASAELAPYSYMENGKPKGLSYEISNAIARAAGYTPNNKFYPLPKVLEALKSGEASVAILVPKDILKGYAEPLGDVLPLKMVVVGQADVKYRQLRDVWGKRIATVRGSQNNPYVKDNKFIPIPTNSDEHSLRLLLSGKVDGVVGPQLGLYYYIKRMKIPPKALGVPLVLSIRAANLHISLANSNEDMRKRLKAAINQLISDGTINELLEKYSL